MWKRLEGNNTWDKTNEANKFTIMECLSYYMETTSMTESSHDRFQQGMAKFCVWLQELGTDDVLNVIPDQIKLYRETELADARYNQLSISVRCVKKICDWAVATGRHDENRMPKLRMPSPSGTPPFIPTAEEIFKIRTTNMTMTRRYTIVAPLEWLIGSGMRCDEMLQLRCCDVNWNPQVYDRELYKISPFVGATIDLDPAKGFRVKNKMQRIVHVSKLAVDITRRYMQIMGLKQDDVFPLFPFTYNQINSAIFKIVEELKLVNEFGLQKDENGKLLNRERDFGDIKAAVEKSQELSPKFRKQFARTEAMRKKIEAKKLSTGKKTRQRVGLQEKPRRGRMSAHACRHFFGVLMWYRDYDGGRHDAAKVRYLMGHKDQRETDKYIEHNRLFLRNDREWKRIVMGNGYEYRWLCKV